MDKTIKITIRNKIASRLSGDYVCGNSDFVAVFDLDEEWENVGLKTARFSYNGTYIDRVFTGDSCPVPVISGTYSIKIGVFAGNLKTTTPAYVPAKKSILCEDGFPADPEPSVYEQLMEQIARLSAGTNMCYTTLEKLNGDLIVRLHGTKDLDLTGAQLRVSYFVQNRNRYKNHDSRSGYWRQPDNYDIKDSPYRWGYAQLEGEEICSGNDNSVGKYYPTVPSWMPNDGYMQTVFEIDSGIADDGFLEINLQTWLLPLLKPNTAGQWQRMGLFGLQKTGKSAIHIRFDLYDKDGVLLGECKNVLHVGANRSKTLSIEGPALSKRIVSGDFYRSIT